jgi:hypothetical protein
MSYTLDRLAAECRRVLAVDPGPAGREKLRRLVAKICKDKAFVAAYVEGASERDLLYEDPELGFCILAHVDDASRQSVPHDHGPTWAIYGQVTGETIMTEWTIVSPRRGDVPGRARRLRSYSMKPGSAHVYNEGAIHSPSRIGANSLIRIEGRNIKKLPYEWFDPA